MEHDCFFCHTRLSKIFQSTYFFVLYDDFPVRQGHMLIVPFRHVAHLTQLTRQEFCDLHSVLQEMVKHMEVEFGAEGYNIGVNNGKVAGQTILHVHIHLIPRYLGDVPNPRGGIRKF